MLKYKNIILILDKKININDFYLLFGKIKLNNVLYIKEINIFNNTYLKYLENKIAYKISKSFINEILFYIIGNKIKIYSISNTLLQGIKNLL